MVFNKSSNTFTVTGTVTGGNLSTGGNLNVTGDTIIAGNLTVSGQTEYTNVSTLAVQDPLIGIGRGANNASLTSNDGKDRGEQLWYWNTAERSAFIGYINSSNPNSSIQSKLVAATQATVTSDVVTIGTYGSFVVGQLEGATVSVTGNITGGNILGGANVNATTHTGTTVSVTGNITGGNVLGGANVNATLLTGTTVSVTGNITGGNIVSGAAVSAASVSASGAVSAATVSASGNITTAGIGNFNGSYMVIPTNATNAIEASVTTVGAFYYNTSNAVLRIRGSVGWVNA
jgi:hypothetical protein